MFEMTILSNEVFDGQPESGFNFGNACRIAAAKKIKGPLGGLYFSQIIH
jgi:hypothetical protein